MASPLRHHRRVQMELKRILLVDDDRELAVMLAEYLEGDGFEVEVAETGQDGLARALSGDHDAVVLDLMLPGFSGLEVLRQLRETSDVLVIMLSARGDEIDKVVGLELGADDYVAKPCYPRELVARLRAHLRRRTGPQERPARHNAVALGDLVVEPGPRRASWNGSALELTATEFNFLAILARAGETVSTKEDLSLRGLGRARQSYDRSVDVHISNLRIKLEAASARRLSIETVRGVGYRLLPA
ncbi:response regulator transcription factor [Novosphingobium olei]|nr:response regulator transcription factor [Novosphingobium olei]